MNECAVGAAPARTYPYGTRHTPQMIADLSRRAHDIVAAARRALARKAGAVIAADWETA
jgi:hypothetical protein